MVGCGGGDGPYKLKQNVVMGVKLSSHTMPEWEEIPVRHTCGAEDLSPPIQWTDVPDDVVSIAITLVNSDTAQGQVMHWLAWNLSGALEGIEEADLPTEAVQGQNDYETVGYKGPCISSQIKAPGRVMPAQWYLFTVYFLDKAISLPSGSSKNELLKEIDGHVLSGGKMLRPFPYNP